MDSQSVVSLESKSEEEFECDLAEIVEESYLLTKAPDAEQKLDELKVLKVDDLHIVLPIFSYLEESSPLESILESKVGDEDLTAVSDEISSEQAANYVKYMKGKLQLAKDMVWENLTKNERRPTVYVGQTSEQPVDDVCSVIDHLREKLQSVQDEMKISGRSRQKVLQMAVKAECVTSLFLMRLEQLGSSRSSKRKRRGDGSRRRRN
ncbi:hypothetical protein MKW98_005637 [Papaver atlanticum]|uniref:Uncharacterized protein n=1 Tax=Papaver atlanticum TaxID=357466 RepID=A0AAD4STB8_9MAGN|nr:hypothetical protein MKW98_005637 [Papaver atlanticum]